MWRRLGRRSRNGTLRWLLERLMVELSETGVEDDRGMSIGRGWGQNWRGYRALGYCEPEGVESILASYWSFEIWEPDTLNTMQSFQSPCNTCRQCFPSFKGLPSLGSEHREGLFFMAFILRFF